MNNFEDIEFSENPEPRCLVSIIIDESSSMAEPRDGLGVPIDELNNSLDSLVTSLYGDPLSRRRCEVSFITYSTGVNNVTEFKTVDDMVLPTLQANGVTATGAAINAALDNMDARKQVIKNNGVNLFRSIVVLFTDGLNTDDITEAKRRIEEYEGKKSIIFFPVGISGYDKEGLKKLCPPNKEPLSLKGLNFDSFWTWLSSSIASVSASTPGDSIKLESPSGWAEM